LEAARLLVGDVIINTWVGQLLLELDRPREAERYFRSLWEAPLVHFYLGVTYEQLGEYDKAQAAYETFVGYWRHADPEFRPLVERARQGVIRLTRLDRE
ncbi:MAG: tol-pal system YbgF family protein, partial [Gemmatimonadota bacterium]